MNALRRKGTRTLFVVFVAAIVMAAMVASALAQQGPIGMVMDDSTHSVIVFDTDTDTVLGVVPIGGDIDGDCSITQDETLGFATDFDYHVWVIDLTTVPPSLASGTNPIPISNAGEDTTISPDQKFLVVVDGDWTEPISVIDIALRAEINTFSVSSDHNSVQVLSDGSVLVTSINTGNVHRLTIDGAGNLVDTGEVLFSGGSGFDDGPNNVFGAPGATSGIVVRRAPQEIRSFTIPGLALVDTRALSGYGLSGLVNPAGDRVYARSTHGGGVDVFGYDSATGALGATPLFSIPIADVATYYGMDQMAITPDGNKLYVSVPGALNVYDAATGNPLTPITDPNIVEPTGVCLAPSSPVVGGVTLPSDPLQTVAPWAGLAALVVLAGAAVVLKKRNA